MFAGLVQNFGFELISCSRAWIDDGKMVFGWFEMNMRAQLLVEVEWKKSTDYEIVGPNFRIWVAVWGWSGSQQEDSCAESERFLSNFWRELGFIGQTAEKFAASSVSGWSWVRKVYGLWVCGPKFSNLGSCVRLVGLTARGFLCWIREVLERIRTRTWIYWADCRKACICCQWWVQVISYAEGSIGLPTDWFNRQVGVIQQESVNLGHPSLPMDCCLSDFVSGGLSESLQFCCLWCFRGFSEGSIGLPTDWFSRQVRVIQQESVNLEIIFPWGLGTLRIQDVLDQILTRTWIYGADCRKFCV
jgi:hypothetical protein